MSRIAPRVVLLVPCLFALAAPPIACGGATASEPTVADASPPPATSDGSAAPAATGSSGATGCAPRPGCASRTSCDELCDGTRSSAARCTCAGSEWQCAARACPAVKCPNTPPKHGTICPAGLRCAYGACQPTCDCVGGTWSCTQDDCVAPAPCGPSQDECGAIGQECTNDGGALCQCVGPTPAIWKCSGPVDAGAG